MGQQHIKADAEQNPGPQPPDIIALVAGEPLDKAIQNQRNQQREAKPHRPQAEHTGHNSDQNTDQFPRTPGADGKLPPPPVKGAVAPAVAAKKDGQPPVEKCDH